MTIAPCKAIFFDISGVLYEGNTVIDGAADTVQQARDKNMVLRFVTNTVSKDSATITGSLQQMGIEVSSDELFTAPVAARQYIQQQQLRPYYLLHPAVRHEFDDIDQSDPNCVLLGDARDELNYASLNKAFQLCKQGMPLIGIGMNKYYRDEQGLNLDAGAFIHAIEWAADTRATIMGKPSAQFYQQVVASTGFDAKDCLMVGDDVQADVLAAIDCGLRACLVRTGKYQSDDEQQLTDATCCIDSVASLFGD